MSHLKKMLLSTTIAAVAASFGASAFAQTAGSAPAPGDTGQPSAQVAPAPQNLVAPSSTDPFVQKRNATAQANAEYSASKKASKSDLKASDKAAKAQYKEQVRNAKINQKADKQAANNELKEDVPAGTRDPGVQH
jgi:hypothetical protein